MDRRRQGLRSNRIEMSPDFVTRYNATSRQRNSILSVEDTQYRRPWAGLVQEVVRQVPLADGWAMRAYLPYSYDVGLSLQPPKGGTFSTWYTGLSIDGMANFTALEFVDFVVFQVNNLAMRGYAGDPDLRIRDGGSAEALSTRARAPSA